MDDKLIKRGGRMKETMTVGRKGPWTSEEDTILVNYVTTHGEGHWNIVASCAGLRRSGKSCRLRWLNYLRPDVRRGNITLEEQILILELHSRWGNRWSKIAEQLPGRTDNEIKNYWRTRVIKQAKQLNCDVNSKKFRDALRYDWIPQLLQRLHHPTTQYSLNPNGIQPPPPLPTTVPEDVSTNEQQGNIGGLENLCNDNMWILQQLFDDELETVKYNFLA